MDTNIDKSLLYQKLYQSFKKSRNDTPAQVVQKMANDVWRRYKNEAKCDKDLERLVLKRIEEELQIATKKKSTFFNFFTKVSV